MKKTTIRDIARIAGVSAATVSRALNGTGTVTEDTKQRIADAIRVTGYQLSGPAPSEFTTKEGFIYLVMRNASTNVYSRLLNHQLMLAADKRGMTLVTANLEKQGGFFEEDISFYLRQAHQIHARGFIISGFTDKSISPDSIKALESCDIPVVSISRTMFRASHSFNHILTGSERGGYLATMHLIDNGRRHLLMVSLPNHHGKIHGFEDAIRSSEVEGIHSQIRFASDESAESCTEALKAALKEDPAIDGILCCSDEVAAYILQALNAMEKKVPDQIELIGYNNNLAPLLNPPISSVRVPLPELAEQTIDLLMDEEQKAPGAPSKSVLLEPQLIIR
ncbi:transcriptional regulator [Lachnospiraceae bacterium JC7]|nr:transcriptional regulator [Lachnospiraceae bacterium JC7]